ncbi:MAG: hypothetical protein FJ206_06765 [Gemmatimonadetes bacterium]|nr:hypothetical protein [Gemmatimonadota bacterium]
MPRLPLFPLSTVLFPEESIPLHIFEPRYRRMLAAAIEDRHRFVLLPPGPDGADPTPGLVGTVARIRAVQPLEDGRSNIVVTGENRVILRFAEAVEGGYLVGEFDEFLDRVDTEGVSRADAARLSALTLRLATAVATLADREAESEYSVEPATLSFQAAALVDWDHPTKQRFLSIRSPAERVARLLASLPGQVARFEARARVHQRATTNGTGKH